jgi:hypothetical protein
MWSNKVRNQKCGGLDFGPLNWSAAERAAETGFNTQAGGTVNLFLDKNCFRKMTICIPDQSDFWMVTLFSFFENFSHSTK